MAELNARYQGFLLKKSVPITSVGDTHFVDTKGIWHDQVSAIGRSAALLLEEQTVVGV